MNWSISYTTTRLFLFPPHEKIDDKFVGIVMVVVVYVVSMVTFVVVPVGLFFLWIVDDRS